MNQLQQTNVNLWFEPARKHETVKDADELRKYIFGLVREAFFSKPLLPNHWKNTQKLKKTIEPFIMSILVEMNEQGCIWIDMDAENSTAGVWFHGEGMRDLSVDIDIVISQESKQKGDRR